jgi:hypothetical protein
MLVTFLSFPGLQANRPLMIKRLTNSFQDGFNASQMFRSAIISKALAKNSKHEKS